MKTKRIEIPSSHVRPKRRSALASGGFCVCGAAVSAEGLRDARRCRHFATRVLARPRLQARRPCCTPSRTGTALGDEGLRLVSTMLYAVAAVVCILLSHELGGFGRDRDRRAAMRRPRGLARRARWRASSTARRWRSTTARELRLIGALAPRADRCRRRARHVAAGGGGARRSCAPSRSASRSSSPSAASAPTATAACRRRPSGVDGDRAALGAGPYARAGAGARLRAGRQPRLRRGAAGGRATAPRGRGAACGRGGLPGAAGRPPAELARYRATFQVVEGRIARVAQVRGVDLSELRRRLAAGACQSRCAARDRGLCSGDFAATPKAPRGQTRARAGLDRAAPAAPTIDLSSAGLIEIWTRRHAACRRGTVRTSAGCSEPVAEPPPPGARSKTARPHGDRAVILRRQLNSARQAALTSASSAAMRRPLALLESTSVMRCTAPRSSSFSTAAISRAMRSSAAS